MKIGGKMKNIMVLPGVVFLLLAVSGCGTASNNKTAGSSDKTSYVEGMKTTLDNWNSDILKLEGNITKFKGKTRSDYKKELSKLRADRDSIKQKLQKIQGSADNSWEKIKKDVEESKIDFEKAISNTIIRFKVKGGS
jgi:septal ring factor EnvC (AmiA/AmiB activator)